MPQYFGAPNGSSRSRRRMVARSLPGDTGRPAEFGGLVNVGRCESAYLLVLLSGGDAAGARGAGGPADSGQDHRSIGLTAGLVGYARVSSHDHRWDLGRQHRHAPAGLTVDPATSWYSLAVCEA